MNVLRLFRRPKPALCGVNDHFVGDPGDLPCRDQATQRVQFHCDGCGPRSRVVCTHHAAVIATDPNVGCETCAAVDDPQPVTFVSAGAP